jgi:hypothetical protein
MRVFTRFFMNLQYLQYPSHPPSHPPLPLGRWCSVTSNHDILETKYKLKRDRDILIKNGVDPYELNKVEKSKEKIVSNYLFLDW